MCCIMTRNNKRNIPPPFLFLFLSFCSSELSTFPHSHSAWFPERWQNHTAVINNCSYLHSLVSSSHLAVIFVGKQVLIQVCLENLWMATSWEPELLQPRCPSQRQKGSYLPMSCVLKISPLKAFSVGNSEAASPGDY